MSNEKHISAAFGGASSSSVTASLRTHFNVQHMIAAASSPGAPSKLNQTTPI